MIMEDVVITIHLAIIIQQREKRKVHHLIMETQELLTTEIAQITTYKIEVATIVILDLVHSAIVTLIQLLVELVRVKDNLEIA